MDGEKKHPGGRPTKLTKDLVDLASRYLSEWKTDDDTVIPTIEGLCLFIDIANKTLLAWEKEKPADTDEEIHAEFCKVADNVRRIQAKMLVNGGINGKFNSTITKLMLGKHGYREMTDVTTD